MKHLLARFLFFLCLSSPVMGQIESLNRQISAAEKIQEPHLKALRLAQISIEYYFYDLERGFSIATKAREWAEKSGHRQAIGAAYTSLADYHRFKGQPEEALKLYLKALDFADEPFEDFPARTYMHMGNYYRMISQFDKTEEYYHLAEQNKPKTDPTSLSADLVYHRGVLEYTRGNTPKGLPLIYQAIAMHHARGDSLRMAETQNMLGRLHKSTSGIDSSAIYFSRAYAYAEKYQVPRLLLFHHNHEAEVNFSGGNLDEAANHYLEALDILQSYDFATYKATTWRGLGHVFQMQGDYAKASEFFLKALTANESMGVKQEMGRIYAIMGWMFVEMGNPSSAEIYGRKSLEIMKGIEDLQGQSFANNLLGQVYFLQGKNTQALEYYELSIEQKRVQGNESAIPATLYNISQVLKAQGKTDQAISLLKEVAVLQEETLNMNNLSMTLNTLALWLIENQQPNQALPLVQRAELMAQEIESATRLRDCYLTFIQYYKAVNNKDMALYYSEQYIQLAQEIGDQKIASKTISYESLSQLQDKERLIDQLSKENQLRKNELALRDLEARTQQIRQVFFLIGIVLTSVLALVFFRYYRLKSKSNKNLSRLYNEIIEQKEHIEAQAEELRSSNDLLQEQQEEILTQSEELTEANHAISQLNESLEKKVVERTLELEKTYRELDTFFYRASHDFRRPITTLKGLAKVAELSTKDDYILELFKKVEETANAMDHLIYKLQEFNLMESEDQQPGEVNLLNLLEEVEGKLNLLIQKKQVKWKLDCLPDGQTPTLFTYPLLLTIILENLLENSLQFCDSVNPAISIQCIQLDDGVQIEVHNNGEWIPEDYLGKVTHMYVKASEKSTGNGLGLFIVSKALRKLDGTLEIQSARDTGTLVRVFIPFLSLRVEAPFISSIR
jgi:signal transduction histidine kinase